jgi:hypothetical protein
MRVCAIIYSRKILYTLKKSISDSQSILSKNIFLAMKKSRQMKKRLRDFWQGVEIFGLFDVLKFFPWLSLKI